MLSQPLPAGQAIRLSSTIGHQQHRRRQADHAAQAAHQRHGHQLDGDVEVELRGRDRLVEAEARSRPSPRRGTGTVKEARQQLVAEMLTPITAAAKSLSRTATSARPKLVRLMLRISSVTTTAQVSARPVARHPGSPAGRRRRLTQGVAERTRAARDGVEGVDDDPVHQELHRQRRHHQVQALDAQRRRAEQAADDGRHQARAQQRRAPAALPAR